MLPGSHHPPLAHIPTNLVVGKSGAAKSRLLKRLEALRPAAEHWAFLVTDSDQATVPPALRLSHRDERDSALRVASIAGGCICCTGSVELRSTLVRLLREARPQRVLIEAPAMASTRELLRLLSDPWLSPVLDLRAVILALDAGEEFPADEADNERLSCAAVMVSNGEQAPKSLATGHLQPTRMDQFVVEMLDLPGPEKPAARFKPEAR